MIPKTIKNVETNHTTVIAESNGLNKRLTPKTRLKIARITMNQ